MDKAGREFWNGSWSGSNIADPVDPSDRRLINHLNRRFHELFMRLFEMSETSSMKLLEIGCGNSAWLPYFSKQFNFKITGLDYSPIGCELARQVLRESKVVGDIVCANLFSPPRYLNGAFDVAVSFGVVEHFEDTASCLRAISNCLKPGGLIFTSIPNMCGLIGDVQRLINRHVYDTHKLVDRDLLKQQHERAGFEVIECEYFLSTNFGVCNLTGIPMSTPLALLKKISVGALARLSMLAWGFEEKFGYFRPNRLFSPYITCVARKR